METRRTARADVVTSIKARLVSFHCSRGGSRGLQFPTPENKIWLLFSRMLQTQSLLMSLKATFGPSRECSSMQTNPWTPPCIPWFVLRCLAETEHAGREMHHAALVIVTLATLTHSASRPGAHNQSKQD